MDIDASIHHQQLEEMEENEMEEEQLRAGSAMAVILLGVVEAYRLCNKQRKPSRLYLCCPQLLRDPHGSTAWQVLYRSRHDCAYITTMGFDVATFHQLYTPHWKHQWQTLITSDG
jgi:hypothetical protein